MRAARTLLALIALSGLCLAQPPPKPLDDDGGPGAGEMRELLSRFGLPPSEKPPPNMLIWSIAAATVTIIGLLSATLAWLLASHAIRKANDAAARSLNQSRRFSADAAHELKTPLAVMQGVVEHAVSHANGNRAVEELGTDVLVELRRLKSIIRRLLLLSQSDAGRLPVHMQKVDLSALMKVMMEDFALLAPNISTTTDFAPDVTVSADRELLTQALHNLFSNAAKYNAGDAIIISSLKVKDKEAVVSISNGIDPFAPPDVERLFERFYRGDPAHGREVEGSGLGLSLARELVQAMGGTLTDAMEGSERVVFKATLPLA